MKLWEARIGVKVVSYKLLPGILRMQGETSGRGWYQASLLLVGAMAIFTVAVLALSFGKLLRRQMRPRGVLLRMPLLAYQLLLLVTYLQSRREFHRAAVYGGMLILLLNILIYFVLVIFLDERMEKLEVEERLAALYTQRQAEMDYMKLAREHIANIHALRQNYTSQFEAIRRMLLENPDTSQVAELVSSSRDYLARNPFPRFCDEEVTNAVLSLKKEMAQKNRIRMEIAVWLPRNIPVEPLDLCSLFCNLLDNAIEACRRNRTLPGVISVKADISGGYLIVKTENPCETPSPVSASSLGWLRTSKENPAEHGYGLKLIERIAEKYHGRMTIAREEQQVSVCVLLGVGAAAPLWS